MSEIAISEIGFNERVKMFSGLIILSIVAVVASFVAINSHYGEVEANLVIENNRAAIIKHNATVEKNNKAIDDQNTKYLGDIEENSNRIYVLRNDLEDIALIQKESLKNELMLRLKKMRQEMQKNKGLLKKILASKKQETKPLPDSTIVGQNSSFSVISIAYADDSNPKTATDDKFSLYYAAALVAAILLLAISILLFSNNEEKIKFSKSLISGILSFAGGAVFGGVAT